MKIKIAKCNCVKISQTIDLLMRHLITFWQWYFSLLKMKIQLNLKNNVDTNNANAIFWHLILSLDWRQTHSRNSFIWFTSFIENVFFWKKIFNRKSFLFIWLSKRFYSFFQKFWLIRRKINERFKREKNPSWMKFLKFDARKNRIFFYVDV